MVAVAFIVVSRVSILAWFENPTLALFELFEAREVGALERHGGTDLCVAGCFAP